MAEEIGYLIGGLGGGLDGYVLWVGQTFGLGAFRGWNGKEPTLIDPVRSRTQRIISYGPLRTIVEVIDRG